MWLLWNWWAREQRVSPKIYCLTLCGLHWCSALGTCAGWKAFQKPWHKECNQRKLCWHRNRSGCSKEVWVMSKLSLLDSSRSLIMSTWREHSDWYWSSSWLKLNLFWEPRQVTATTAPQAAGSICLYVPPTHCVSVCPHTQTLVGYLTAAKLLFHKHKEEQFKFNPFISAKAFRGVFLLQARNMKTAELGHWIIAK